MTQAGRNPHLLYRKIISPPESPVITLTIEVRSRDGDDAIAPDLSLAADLCIAKAHQPLRQAAAPAPQPRALHPFPHHLPHKSKAHPAAFEIPTV